MRVEGTGKKVVQRQKGLRLNKFGNYINKLKQIIHICILSILGISKKELTAFTLEGIWPVDFIRAHF